MLGLNNDRSTTLYEIAALLDKNERERVKSLYGQAFKANETSFIIEHSILPLNSSPIRVQQEAEITYLDNGHCKIAGTLHDITEEISNKEQIFQLAYYLSHIHIPSPRDRTRPRMPSSASKKKKKKKTTINQNVKKHPAFTQMRSA